MSTISDILAQNLYRAGCRYATGMAGGEVLSVIDSLRRAKIKFFATSHENSGGFIAEGIFHGTNVSRNIAPALLVATLGPGAMNCVNVVANAFQEKVPMVLLTGCIDEKQKGIYTHQVMEHKQVFSSITKATFTISKKNYEKTIKKAIAICLTPPFGPVHIDVPFNVADMPAKPCQINFSLPSLVVPKFSKKVFATFEKYKKPVAIIGMDALGSTNIKKLLEYFSIPFITTYKAKGIVSEHHKLSLGAAGLSPLADECLKPIIEEADLILCLGYDPIEMRIGWKNIWDIKKCMVIEISETFAKHGMHKSTFKIKGNINMACDILLKSCKQNKKQNPLLLPTKKLLAEKFPAHEKYEKKLSAAAIINEAQNNLPKNTIATADSGAHRILLSQMWKCTVPNSLLQSTAFCTMGCAIPLAMGYKLAQPKRPVVAFSGDGGLLMVAGELANAKKLGGGLIFIIFVDSSLALIELKQNARKLKSYGVDVPYHNFATLARAFGGQGFEVRTRRELKLALAKSLKSDIFTLIAAHLPKGSYEKKF